MPPRADVVVVGAGHNGLVAATFLARSGLDVVVVEAGREVGGAAKTEQPFARVPGLSQSTGAYLLGLMPPELPRKLGVEFPVLRRLLATDTVSRFVNLQIQFHSFVPNASDERERIREGLSKSHELTYDYPFLWENWRRKS